MTSLDENGSINRVVHVIYSGLGGHAAVMFSLIAGGFLSRAKHFVILAGVETPLPDYVDQLDRLGVPWTYVQKSAGRGHFGFYRQIWRAFHNYKPDLIFLNGLAAVPATINLRIPNRRRRPLVLLRESEPVQLKSRFEWSVLALAHAVVDRIVHLTPEAAEGAKAKLGILCRRNKVKIVPNGLDTIFFKPDEQPCRGSEVHFGMISRLQHKKDHVTLIAAFDQIRRARPDLLLKLHIGGDGTTRTLIENEVKRRGLAESVILHGLLGRMEVREFLSKLDIYVHATFGETMSNSIMQAMAMKLPVIASDVNGVRNMVTADLGVLYPSRDVNALASCMLHYIDCPKDRLTAAANARSQAVKRYDIRSVVKQYEEVVGEHAKTLASPAVLG